MKIFLIIACSIIFLSCQQGKNISKDSNKYKTQDQFWNSLAALCGKSFYGILLEAPANDTVFRNRQLILHIKACRDNKIMTPFHVGSNRSRTFVFTKHDNSIQLQHDHRHIDGKEDSITMYGGYTSNSGKQNMQVFPADQHTVNMLPAAAGNVWWIEITEGKFITYNLRRMGTDRLFSVRFNLNDPAPTPPDPWGWNK